MDKRFLQILPLAAALLVVLGVSGTTVFRRPAPKPPVGLPVYARVPDFVLTERSGREVALRDLAGRPWIADFIFTRCGGICPMMSSKMAALAKDLKDDTQFVSFTVDPEVDSPAVLAEYAKKYEADPERWLFLTGSRDTLNAITTALHMNKIDEPMMHSASFVLVDASHAVRGYYDSNDPAAIEKLKRDHARLIEIPKNLY